MESQLVVVITFLVICGQCSANTFGSYDPSWFNGQGGALADPSIIAPKLYPGLGGIDSSNYFGQAADASVSSSIAAGNTFFEPPFINGGGPISRLIQGTRHFIAWNLDLLRKIVAVPWAIIKFIFWPVTLMVRIGMFFFNILLFPVTLTWRAIRFFISSTIMLFQSMFTSPIVPPWDMGLSAVGTMSPFTSVPFYGF